jgi:hypothetical protein
MAPYLKTGYPPGSTVEASETGYMNSDVFFTRQKHFIACVRQSPEKTEKTEKTVLFVLDGHTTCYKILSPRL